MWKFQLLRWRFATKLNAQTSNQISRYSSTTRLKFGYSVTLEFSLFASYFFFFHNTIHTHTSQTNSCNSETKRPETTCSLAYNNLKQGANFAEICQDLFTGSLQSWARSALLQTAVYFGFSTYVQLPNGKYRPYAVCTAVCTALELNFRNWPVRGYTLHKIDMNEVTAKILLSAHY